MKIWAHRGCSQNYPENTLLAFEKALELKELAGIELDIQLTKDGKMVVIHDEKVDRTTEGLGYVKDFSLKELKKLHIYAGQYVTQEIPTIEEVLDLAEERLKSGLKLNIELKNSLFLYEGMEEKILDLISKRNMRASIVFSSFSAKSMEKMKKLDSDVEIAILDTKVSDCLYKMRGIGADALHPYWKGMDLPVERLDGYTVRAYFAGHLYPEPPTGTKLNFSELEKKGITDVFLNEPEVYIR